MNFTDIQTLEDQYQLKTYGKFPFALVRGNDCHVWDSEDREYLDLYGGHAVCIVGHNHPHWVAALQRQLETLSFYSNVCYSDIRAQACHALISTAPDNMSSVFLCNSGSEANETAIKIARKHTNRKTIVSMRNGFHGRTLGSLSACGIENYRDPAYDLNPHHAFADFMNLESAAAVINTDTAAVLLEPIQSMGGMATATPEYLQGLRTLCDEAGALLILDEIQTFARTGAMFAAQSLNVRADIITLAKGLAGSMPCGAVVIDAKVADTVQIGDQGTTFGGSQLACAGILAVQDILEREDLVSRAMKMRDHLQQGLQTVSAVDGLLGSGLLVGIKMQGPAKAVQKHMLHHNILCSTTATDPNIVRLMPPLTVQTEDLDRFIETLHSMGDIA